MLVAQFLASKDKVAPSEAQEEMADLIKRLGQARLWSLRGGLDTLVTRTTEHLAADDRVTLRTNTAAVKIRPARKLGGPVTLELSDGSCIEAEHVVSALPAWCLSRTLASSDTCLANHLDKIPFASMVVVNVIYAGSVLPFDGFGYLVPTTENDNRVLGVVFDSAVFPEQQPPNQELTRLTVMSGGYAFDRLYGDLSPVEQESRALEISLHALRHQLGILPDPQETNVVFWRKCMPQYIPDHAAVCQVIQDHLAPGSAWDGRLHLTGNSFYGVGVNDAVRHAVATAEKVSLAC